MAKFKGLKGLKQKDLDFLFENNTVTLEDGTKIDYRDEDVYVTEEDEEQEAKDRISLDFAEAERQRTETEGAIVHERTNKKFVAGVLTPGTYSLAKWGVNFLPATAYYGLGGMNITDGKFIAPTKAVYHISLSVRVLGGGNNSGVGIWRTNVGDLITTVTSVYNGDAITFTVEKTVDLNADDEIFFYFMPNDDNLTVEIKQSNFIIEKLVEL